MRPSSSRHYKGSEVDIHHSLYNTLIGQLHQHLCSTFVCAQIEKNLLENVVKIQQISQELKLEIKWFNCWWNRRADFLINTYRQHLLDWWTKFNEFDSRSSILCLVILTLKLLCEILCVHISYHTKYQLANKINQMVLFYGKNKTPTSLYLHIPRQP